MEQKTEFVRNDLVLAVIWPTGPEAFLSLIDAEGVFLGGFNVVEPVRGSEIAKMVPDGLRIHFNDCSVINTSGRLVYGKKQPFDSAVVTERAQQTFEERFAALERKERYRDRRAKRLEAELQSRIEEVQRLRDVPEVVVEGLPPEGAEPIKGVSPEPVKAPEGSVETEGTNDA